MTSTTINLIDFTDQMAKAAHLELEYFHPNNAKRYRDHRVQIIKYLTDK